MNFFYELKNSIFKAQKVGKIHIEWMYRMDESNNTHRFISISVYQYISVYIRHNLIQIYTIKQVYRLRQITQKPRLHQKEKKEEDWGRCTTPPILKRKYAKKWYKKRRTK